MQEFSVECTSARIWVLSLTDALLAHHAIFPPLRVTSQQNVCEGD